MSNLYAAQKDSYDAFKNGKVLIDWTHAIDCLRKTQAIDMRDMDRFMIKYLHACARVYVNQFKLGRAMPVAIIDSSLRDEPSLAKRIYDLLFLKTVQQRSNAQIRYSQYLDSKADYSNIDLFNFDLAE